jgi:hypothetical protein
MAQFFLLFIVSSGFALLPPLAQSAREMQAILSDPRLYESLSSAEVIQEVMRNEAGYLVVTQNYTLQVDLRTISREPKNYGPARFELEFHLPAAKF